MNTNHLSLKLFLNSQQQAHKTDQNLCSLIESIAHTCQKISGLVSQGALENVLGSAGSSNIQGETQQKLDVLTNNMLIDSCQASGFLSGLASEELDEILITPSQYSSGDYLLLFDPLDGSSNIDVNVSIGTIFSILKKPTHHNLISEKDFLQKGSEQVAAGYVLYGPQTTLVLTLGQGVFMFTLDKSTKEYLLTRENVLIPEDSKEFSINMSNMRHWAPPVRKYVEECLAGSTGPRQKDFNMRWIASMVADVHRILTRGGIVMYPWDQREPGKPGKLRLMYEANPMSFLIEQAGGASINSQQNILSIQPLKLHERVSVILGSKNEVAKLLEYHQGL